MSDVHTLSISDVRELTRFMAERINDKWTNGHRALNVYAVPRGGVPVAMMLAEYMSVIFVSDVSRADIIVDDIIDSGATRARLKGETMRPHGADTFYALIDKTSHDNPYRGWVVFPWEVSEDGDQSVTDNVTRLLQHMGEDHTREGLLETPKRYVKAWSEWTSGYDMDPASILKCFEDGATDEMVVETRIPFFSNCEHHMAPFFGTVDIGYIPQGRIVGLSKMNRLVECFSRRLQVQERLTGQIADAMHKELGALGVGVVVRAQHMCVMSRGVRHAGCETITSAMRGVFMEGAARAEFLSLIK